MGRIEDFRALEVLKELPAVVRVIGNTYEYRSILKSLGYQYGGYKEAGWLKKVDSNVGEEIERLKEKLPYLVIWSIRHRWGEKEEAFREPHLYIELYLDKEIFEKMEVLYKDEERLRKYIQNYEPYRKLLDTLVRIFGLKIKPDEIVFFELSLDRFLEHVIALREEEE